MSDEKDRLGNKLRDLERAREDTYFAQRDRELLEKLRQAKTSEQGDVLRQAAIGRCPRCGAHLQQKALQGVNVDECPECGGIWLDKGEYEALAKPEHEGWFARLLGR